MNNFSGIYCVENTVNGKKYIGQGKNVQKRMLAKHSGCSFLLNAFNKYGKNKFKTDIIVYCEEWELGRLEKECIKIYRSHFSNSGYNISWGGDTPSLGLKASLETRNKMSSQRKGEKHPMFGKIFSQESRLKMSISHKGQKKGISLSESHREKIGLANKNKIMTVEQKQKISVAMKGKPWSKARRSAQINKGGQS